MVTPEVIDRRIGVMSESLTRMLLLAVSILYRIIASDRDQSQSRRAGRAIS